MIKLIIFDAYGVILRGGYPITSKIIASKFKLDQNKVYEILYTKYFNQAALRKITQNEAWGKAIEELQLPISVTEIKRIHFSQIGINNNVLEFARGLKKDYQILLLSKNTRSQLSDTLKKLPAVRKVFGKNIINTWEYGLPKASKETMEFISKRFNTEPKKIAYTDDQQINLDAAAKMGAKVILYKNFTQFKNSISKKTC